MTTAIERLQSQSDRAKVNKWLDFIHEHDPACREEVMEQCAKDKDTRVYYLARAKEDLGI